MVVLPTEDHVCQMDRAGVMVLSNGMVRSCMRHSKQPEAALMFGIAHEIGHYVARHLVSRFQRFVFQAVDAREPARLGRTIFPRQAVSTCLRPPLTASCGSSRIKQGVNVASLICALANPCAGRA